jgi:hypothetical protein
VTVFSESDPGDRVIEMQVYQGVNRPKYDVTQRSARWAMERDRVIEALNVATITAAACCADKKGQHAECKCAVHAPGEPYEPLGLASVGDTFAEYRY